MRWLPHMSIIKENTMLDIHKIRQDFPILSGKYTVNHWYTSTTPPRPKNRARHRNHYRWLYPHQRQRTSRRTPPQPRGHRRTRARPTTCTTIPPCRPRQRNHFYTRHYGIDKPRSPFVRTAFLHDGDEIIISEMEHHANIVPWQLLQSSRKIKLRVIPVDDKGVLDMNAFRAAFNEKTKLVSITHVSNVLGTINPIQRYYRHRPQPQCSRTYRRGARRTHQPVDVQALDVDFYVLSAHKMYGPTGIGILYGKKNGSMPCHPIREAEK